MNELAETKTSKLLNRNTNAASWQRDPRSLCINSLAGKRMTSLPETVAGEEIIAGYRAVKIKASDKVTWWFALDCGCAMVKSRMDFSENEYSEKNLVALIPGEPDALLFHVPEQAREVSPSERMLGTRKDCAGCKPRTLQILRRLDAEYESRRVPIAAEEPIQH